MSKQLGKSEGAFLPKADDGDEAPAPEPSPNGAGPKDGDKEPTLDETLPGGGRVTLMEVHSSTRKMLGQVVYLVG